MERNIKKNVVLVCNSPFGTDGISLFVLNNHRFYRRKDVTYHLIYSSIHSSREVVDGYVCDFCRDGDKARFISKEDGLVKYANTFIKYLKQNKIDIVHVHGSSSAILLEIVSAKIAGVKKIIAHSHSTRGNHSVIHRILRPLVNMLSDVKVACGELSGKWMYGNKQSFVVIPNCINISKYVFDGAIRKRVRDSIHIGDDITLIGHVGAFTEVKNQVFLLKVMKSLKEHGLDNYRLLLIGHGPLKEEVINECKKADLNDCVSFLGNRDDIPQLMMAMDVFCLPSLYEGFPITVVEAQATGLKTLVSSNVSSEVCITDLVFFLPINQGTKIWVESIINKNLNTVDRKDYNIKIRDAGYDIEQSAKIMEYLYTK